jgi:phenylpyruvate tautomerase PptA (4-oxalocrotonate tautomerase family)
MKLIEAVQAALVTCFRIPEGDRDIVLDLYDPTRRIVSEGRPERYTRVEIIGIAARSDDAKRALFAAVVSNLELTGVPRDEIRIFVIEAPASHWGVNGGIPASEVDLGFKVHV